MAGEDFTTKGAKGAKKRIKMFLIKIYLRVLRALRGEMA